MKKVIGLFVAVMFFSLASNAQCGWIDGQDSKNAEDPGRGVSNAADHRNYVLNSGGYNQAANLVFKRVNTLKDCLNLVQYARMYADVSVLIADYGIRLAGWKNEQDSRCPSDPGRGVKDWKGHNDYIANAGIGNSPVFIKNRMESLMNELSKKDYAKLFGDVSVIIAKYGRM